MIQTTSMEVGGVKGTQRLFFKIPPEGATGRSRQQEENGFSNTLPQVLCWFEDVCCVLPVDEYRFCVPLLVDCCHIHVPYLPLSIC